MSRSNPCLAAVCNELDRVGVRSMIDVRRHVHIKWQHGDADRQITVSVSPSSRNAQWNARADCRRVLRADGLI
jgi:hypothetical protein